MARLASAFDGQFYPAEPEALVEVVDHFLGRAPHPPEGRTLGLLLPHAGYVYSGRTAGMAVGSLKGRRPDAVLLLGPSHRTPVRGVRVFSVEGFDSPLGPIPSDPEIADRLIAELGPDASGPAFPEHSVEVQLPLLARALPGVPIVEIVYGPPELAVSSRVAQAIDRLSETHDLLVAASSDLSHFYDGAHARVLDARFRELLCTGTSLDMAQSLTEGQVEACGAGAVLTLMCLAETAGAGFQVVDQTDSSETSGDEERVVGYLSALAVAPEVSG